MADRETIDERIRADHRAAMEGIVELERRVAGRYADTRRPVFGLMRTDLLVHMTAEEGFVYDLLEKEMRPWIENARREHQEIREHLAALAADGMPAPAWEGRLHELRLVLERHIAEEERAVIPQVEMKYDLERLRELGDEFTRRKMAALAELGA